MSQVRHIRDKLNKAKFKAQLEEQRSRPEPIVCGPLTLKVANKNGDYWDVGVYFNGEARGVFFSSNSDQYMGSLPSMPKEMWKLLEVAAKES